MNTANQSPAPPVRPPPDGYEWLADVYARVVAPEGAHETVRYALANDRIKPQPILRDQHGERWTLPRRTWDKDGGDKALREGWAQLNMDYPDPSGFYASGHIFVPKGGIESFLGIGSRPPRDEDARKPGAEANLIDVEENEERDPAYFTRLPGRPSIRHLIIKEFERRAGEGETEPDLPDEAAALYEWAEREHPRFPTPTQKTIENHIRAPYRKLATDNPTK